ncbi:cytidine deaminase [Erysipelothrix inopinata]|uniref:Cytidine deaminase n=1 Tax=Erysipelothrix inopinata TaxID=225084 RepID=A0A7G9RY99_9FIRM|nr:cytidine deaminase [Erysipelothrix inopinata]QNN60574.1 cytidine deaminase [Erysipelothrix inopinata]
MKETLLEKAFEAMNNAYVPYSNYRVGSCVLTHDGQYFIGANVENASYGATNCGERSAIFACYSHGYRQKDIAGIAIVTDGQLLAGPCGICRQVLSELLESDTPIYLSNKKEEMTTTIAELMPLSFGMKDLEDRM